MNVPQELQELWDYEKAHPDNRDARIIMHERTLRYAHEHLLDVIHARESVEDTLEAYLDWVSAKASWTAAVSALSEVK